MTPGTPSIERPATLPPTPTPDGAGPLAEPAGGSLRLAPPLRRSTWIGIVFVALVTLAGLTWTLVHDAGTRSGQRSVEDIAHWMMASALCAWVCARSAIRRRGLAPTSDERFSWLDRPARREAYEHQVASRLPAGLRFLETVHKPLFFGGYALLVLSGPVARLLGWAP